MTAVKRLIEELEYSLLESFLGTDLLLARSAAPKAAKPKKKPAKRKTVRKKKVTKKEVEQVLQPINLTKLRPGKGKRYIPKQLKPSPFGLEKRRTAGRVFEMPLPMLIKQVRKVLDDQGYIYLGNFNLNNVFINQLAPGLWIPSIFALGVNGADEDDIIEENAASKRGFIDSEKILNRLIAENQAELTKSVARYYYNQSSYAVRQARDLKQQDQEKDDCKRLFKGRKSRIKPSEMDKVNWHYLRDAIHCDGVAKIKGGEIYYLSDSKLYQIVHPDLEDEEGTGISFYKPKELQTLIKTDMKYDYFTSYMNKNIR
jgi:hypothetical protein